MNKSERFDNLIAPLIAHLSKTALLVEVSTLAAIAMAVWFGLRQVRQHLQGLSGWHDHIAHQDWNRLILPALLLPFVLIGRTVLANWQNVHLFNLVVPLLLSFLAIQSCFYLLRHVLKPTHTLYTVERLVSWLIWGVLALHITGYLPAVIKAMDAVGFDVGKQHISLYSVLMGAISLALTLIAALWLATLMQHRLIDTMPITPNIRLALSKLMRTVLLALAVLIALPLVGIDITVLSVFGGALGVGLGMGLQKIAANYVSGFTLLLDQSVRIGDMIEVNHLYGEVKEIATRYTVIRSLNGTENIIPNETMITMPVINHSLTNKENQIALPIQVAYSSDLAQVRDLLLDIALHHNRVLKTQDIKVRLRNFGENGIDMELVFWITDPEEGEFNLRSDLNWEIWEAFKREHIEIPFPQRVIHQG